ncbi:class I SAM-dependent methyltransferase [Nitratireductor sp. GCM10026969]|uniref:class I SAM-dependent methyltransferase n=1 Tax=Nitratireductor sp. GCM10026969 TaxID=3252645 RepID=UPI0036128819
MNEALPTLLFPFDRGMLDAPAAGERVLFVGARAGLHLPDGFAAAFHLVQGFRPDYLALERAGFIVTPEAEHEGYDAAILLMTRHRRGNENALAETLQRVKPGGLIVAAGTKTDGAASFRKRMAGLMPLEDHAAKHHGIVFWLRRPDELSPAVTEALAPAGASAAAGFETAPGGFSEDGIDAGSRLLADNLPDDLAGDIADFAAGWGYLATCVAGRFAPRSLDLYEAHFASLEAAKRNMAAHAPGRPCGFFWQDLLGEPVERRYDAIVMNPPFHTGRAAEPGVGGRMIAVAAGALRPGGRLFLVANRPLPYEAAMESAFPRHGEICRDAMFKVLWGRR